MSIESHKITKAAFVVGGSTLLSRILGFVRDILIFRYFDKTATDAFIVAFRLPNLMRRFFGEGSLSISFIPVFTDYLKHKTEEERQEFVAVCFTYLSIAVTAFTALGIIFAPEIIRFLAMGPGFSNVPEKYAMATELLRVMFPYLIFISLVALAMGVLNSLQHFFAPAIAPVLLNMGIISGVLFLQHFFEMPIMGVAWGVIIGGAAQVLLQIPWLIKKGYFPRLNFNFRHSGLRKVVYLMIPAILGLSSAQISVIIVQEFASFLDYEGAVSYLFLADRLVQFPLGVFAIAFGTALLPSLSANVASEDKGLFRANFVFGFRFVSFVSIPALVGLFVLSVPLIRIFFERGHFTSEASFATAEALSMYALGLWSASILRVLVPAFYAFKNTFIPALIAFGGLVINTALCFLLIGSMKHSGLALATSLASFIHVFFLLVYFKRHYIDFSWKEVFLPQVKYVFAALIMGAVLHYFKAAQADNIGLLCFFIMVGIGVYAVICYILKVEELSQVKRVLFR